MPVTNAQSGTRIDEIEAGVYRISTPVPPNPGLPTGFTFNQYLVVDEFVGPQSATSYRPLFLVLISRQIKTGSLRRSERNGRYNRLMEIAIRAATRSLASRR